MSLLSRHGHKNKLWRFLCIRTTDSLTKVWIPCGSSVKIALFYLLTLHNISSELLSSNCNTACLTAIFWLLTLWKTPACERVIYLLFVSFQLPHLFKLCSLFPPFIVVVIVLYFLLLNTLDTETAEFPLVNGPACSSRLIFNNKKKKGCLPGDENVFSLRGVKWHVAAEKSVINCFIRPLFIM